jgi:Uma2 family endonuclease
VLKKNPVSLSDIYISGMEATLEKPGIKPVRTLRPSEAKRRFDTLEKFIRWKPEDGYKYEWNNGVIEKSPKMIIPENLHLVDRLSRLFHKTAAYAQGGLLLSEPGTKTSPNQLRIPDMGFYNPTQLLESRKGVFLMPEFALEFVSDNDTYKKCLNKVDEYFTAGAKVVWLVLPELKLVYVYTSPLDVHICRGARVCSAEPAIPGFKISAGDLFA